MTDGDAVRTRPVRWWSPSQWSPARWWPRSWRPATLRARMVVILLACLIVCCAAVAIVSTLALHRFLLNRLDQQLTQASDRYAVSLEHQGDGDADDREFGAVLGQSAGTLGARVKDGDVTALGIIDEPSVQRRADADTRAAIAAQAVGHARTVDLPRLGDYRIVVTNGRDGDQLVTGLPEHPVDETIGRLLAIEGIVFAVLVVVAGAVVAFSVRLSMRPLTRVTGTALAVSELPLATGEVELPGAVPNASPRGEAGQVAAAFNRMLEHVQTALTQRHASEERLRAFAADAGHELRTPVAVVRSHAEFVQRSAPPQDAEARRALDRIVAEADRMGSVVEDLLTLARLDQSRALEGVPVDLGRVALEAVEDARVAGPDQQWRLDLPEDPVVVLGDAHALHQAVANLLANARTHTPPGTTVTVAVRVVPGRRAILTVTDDGPGIPPDEQPRLFERFVRGRRARAGSEGAGLGLSIVAAIVAAHGGTITVASEAGHTEFRVELATTDATA